MLNGQAFADVINFTNPAIDSNWRLSFQKLAHTTNYIHMYTDIRHFYFNALIQFALKLNETKWSKRHQVILGKFTHLLFYSVCHHFVVMCMHFITISYFDDFNLFLHSEKFICCSTSSTDFVQLLILTIVLSAMSYDNCSEFVHFFFICRLFWCTSLHFNCHNCRFIWKMLKLLREKMREKNCNLNMFKWTSNVRKIMGKTSCCWAITWPECTTL